MSALGEPHDIDRPPFASDRPGRRAGGLRLPSRIAVDALPDARFVGFAQADQRFRDRSGQLALAKSANENVRGYATRLSPSTRRPPRTAQVALRGRRLLRARSQRPAERAGDAAPAQLPARRRIRRGLCQRPARRADRGRSTSIGAFSQNGKRRPAAPLRADELPKSKTVPRVRQAPGRRPLGRLFAAFAPRHRSPACAGRRRGIRRSRGPSRAAARARFRSRCGCARG